MSRVKFSHEENLLIVAKDFYQPDYVRVVKFLQNFVLLEHGVSKVFGPIRYFYLLQRIRNLCLPVKGAVHATKGSLPDDGLRLVASFERVAGKLLDETFLVVKRRTAILICLRLARLARQ